MEQPEKSLRELLDECRARGLISSYELGETQTVIRQQDERITLSHERAHRYARAILRAHSTTDLSTRRGNARGGR